MWEADAKVSLPPRYRTHWRQPFHDRVRELLDEGMTVLDVGPAAYDELVVADLATPVDTLEGSIDLAISWQVVEHVKPLDRASDNLHRYLKSGRSLVSLFSGK